MIWGETTEQAAQRRESWQRAFAWIPVQLWDGRWCWWCYYWVRTSRLSPNGDPGVFLSEQVQRLLEIPEVPAKRDQPPPPKPIR